MPKSSFVARPP